MTIIAREGDILLTWFTCQGTVVTSDGLVPFRSVFPERNQDRRSEEGNRKFQAPGLGTW